MKKKGFTLIELIISMAILLIVVTGVGTAVEASNSMYAKNSNDLQNTEYTNKIIQYFKGQQLNGLDGIYGNTSPAGTKFFYLYFKNNDPSGITSESLNHLLSLPNPTPVVETSQNAPNYTRCSTANISNFPYGAIVELTKHYDYDTNDNTNDTVAAQSYNFYTYNINVTLFDFNNGQDIQSQLNVLVSR